MVFVDVEISRRTTAIADYARLVGAAAVVAIAVVVAVAILVVVSHSLRRVMMLLS